LLQSKDSVVDQAINQRQIKPQIKMTFR